MILPSLPEPFRMNAMFPFWKDWEHSQLFEDLSLPWEALNRLSDYLEAWQKDRRDERFHPPKSSAYHCEGPVWIGPGTHIEPGAMIRGPVIIGANCQIRHGAYVRDGVVIGAHSIIGHCVEVKASVLMPECEVPHFNYVGDSVLGRRVHLGAGAVLSNVRQDRQDIEIRISDAQGNEHFWESHRWKLGAILADGVEVGCNAVLNPGLVAPSDWTARPGKSYSMKDVNRWMVQSK